MSGIPVRVQKEGNSAFLSGEQMKYQQCSVTSSFPARDAQGMSKEEFFGTAAQLGHDLAGEQAKGLFAKLSEPTPYTMPVTFESPLTFKQLLETWQKMEVRFDKEGKPVWPTIMCSAQIRQELHENLPKWLEDMDCQKALRDLAEVKRKEFDEREARRRLVD